MIRALVATFALLLAAPALADLPVEQARVLRMLPHDPAAFTEGLFIDRGQLVESTGMEGRSTIRRVDLATGHVLASVSLPPSLFGEGVAPWRGTILSLTWQNGFGFRWQPGGKDPWLRPISRFTYLGEGWALTGDGHQLIMSDGTDTLRFIEPDQFRTTRLLKVTAEGQPVTMLNELEYVNGEILANIWTLPCCTAAPACPAPIRWPTASPMTPPITGCMSPARNGRCCSRSPCLRRSPGALIGPSRRSRWGSCPAHGNN